MRPIPPSLLKVLRQAECPPPPLLPLRSPSLPLRPSPRSLLGLLLLPPLHPVPARPSPLGGRRTRQLPHLLPLPLHLLKPISRRMNPVAGRNDKRSRDAASTSSTNGSRRRLNAPDFTARASRCPGTPFSESGPITSSNGLSSRAARSSAGICSPGRR